MKKNYFIYIAGLALMASSCIKKYDNPSEGTPGSAMSVFALRQAYQGNPVDLNSDQLGGASTVSGVIISSNAGNNIDGNSFVLQENLITGNTMSDAVRGIIVKLNSSSSVVLGDSVRVNVSGARLERLSGKLTLTNIASDKVTKLGTVASPLIRSVTQGMLNENMEQYESTLVSINADVTDYAMGATMSGLKKLNDNTGPSVYVHSLNGSAVAALPVPQDAQFTGVAGFFNQSGNDTAGALRTIMMRTTADLSNISNVLYAGFPESFETPDASTKSSYNVGTNAVALGTGNWTLLQTILANTLGSDKINAPGKQSVRMQQNLTTSGYVQMNYDLPDGASKVTVFYGRYGTDAKSAFRLESSVNGGTTWTAIGANITDMPDKGMKQAVWTMNITTPVRFRINKIGLGTSNNGRLSLDDMAIYKKL